MVKIVPTPDWFIGKDVVIEVFSLVVLAIFVFLAYRYYRMNKNRNILYLGSGFGLIALAQPATILTKLVFYYAGFFFHRFLTLSGLYILYRLPRDRKSIGDYVIVIYFILISSFLSREIFY